MLMAVCVVYRLCCVMVCVRICIFVLRHTVSLQMVYSMM